MLSGVSLSVIMLRIVKHLMLSVIMLKIAMRLMLHYVMLSGIMLIQVMQRAIMLNVIRLRVFMH
jgi:hypothetical protein